MEPEAVFTILGVIQSGLFGLVIGSFLNVCIYRIPEGRTVVKGHSMCMSCSHTLGALDMVPLFSWMFLRGKCRYCGAPVASRYAKIEALTGAVFALFALVRSDWLFFPGDPIREIPDFIRFLMLLVMACIVIVAMMIQKDHGTGIRGASIVIAALLGCRLALLFFSPDDAAHTLLSAAEGLGAGVAAVMIALIFSPAQKERGSYFSGLIRLEGIKHYFSPEAGPQRISDALLVSVCAAIGFPPAVVCAVVYALARIIAGHKKILPFLGIITAAFALIGFLILKPGVF
jgi:prepilin signal peptidase PulO-like enzyme (type II secretory pathway)